jgi:hypothetical protein
VKPAFRVVIAGGGVAAIEAALALRELAPERVALTIAAAATDFVYRPLAVLRPFREQPTYRIELARVAADLEAGLVAADAVAVEADDRQLVLSDGQRLDYDALLRSKAAGLTLSDRVGHRVSANGAAIGFAYDGERAIDGVGCNPGLPITGRPVGPATTGIADARPGRAMDDGVVLFDAAVPGALGRLAATTVGFAGMTGTVADDGEGDGVAGAIGHWLHRAAAHRGRARPARGAPPVVPASGYERSSVDDVR